MTDAPIVELLLAPGRALLDEARADRGRWERFRPAPVENDDSHLRDPRWRDRAQIAWALQYDAREGDEALLRFLLEQEIRWREEDPWQGVGETLEILAWRVACAPRVEDVWLFARAKGANFDCGCGFDREHLFAAGVEATLAHVRESARPERDHVLAQLVDDAGAPRVDEEALASWRAQRARWLPAEPEPDPMVWFERAIQLDRRDLARELLERWRAAHAPTRDDLSRLVHCYRDLGDHAREAELRRAIASALDAPFDLARELAGLADAERRAGQPERAHAALLEALPLHRANPRWAELGLGRAFVEQWLALALAFPRPGCRAVFAAADRELQRIDAPTLPLLRAAVAAAEHAGESERAAHYAARVAAY